MNYSIIIPLHNEDKTLNKLLIELKPFSINNEIIIINDGSTDQSKLILSDCKYVKLINLDKNIGKGGALRIGIKNAKNNKIIITDADLELNTNEIKNLMILDKNSDINFIIGSRFNKINPFKSIWDMGNYSLTKLFNIINKSKFSDALCCAKSFYKTDINLDNIKSKKFDIDVELTSLLLKSSTKFKICKLSYIRRGNKQGKKLKFRDGWKVFYRIIRT